MGSSLLVFWGDKAMRAVVSTPLGAVVEVADLEGIW